MKRTSNNTRTVQINSHNNPFTHNTTTKISYLPSLNLNFQQLIANRLKVSNNPQSSKSIFFLKSKLTKQDPRYKKTFLNLTLTRNNLFPQVSTSTNLQSPKNIHQLHLHTNSLPKQFVNSPSTRRIIVNRNLNIYKRRSESKQEYKSQERSRGTGLCKGNYFTIGCGGAEENKKAENQIDRSDQMVIGNRTVLNFRNNTNEKQIKKKKKFEMTNKVKFSTFNSHTHDICPWRSNEIQQL